MSEHRISPVILAGGSGTRLWPLSREHHPKQLFSITSEHTMLQDTARRLEGLAGVEAPWVICNEEYRFLIAEQLRQVGLSARQIILEPAGRNTAPALTLAALAQLEAQDDSVMLAMPTDHVIRDPVAFRAAVVEAVARAESGLLVAFGVMPTRPETAFGYIRRGAHNRVAAFVEKPDLATATAFVDSGEYLWNSGLFAVRPSVWLTQLEKFRPDIVSAARVAFCRSNRERDFLRVDHDSFLGCPSDSIDYAVMEKTSDAVFVELAGGWSDVGVWPSFSEVCEADGNGNVCQGDVIKHNVRNNLLLAKSRLLAAIGVDDLVIVETADAVLVASKNQAQDVREVVDRLKATGRDEYKVHRKMHRPWGFYENIDTGPRFQVKRITVNPGAAISLQLHHHRAEHWIVVKGTARITRGDDVYIVAENESTYIPLGIKHRLENPGKIPLEMIEVQSGPYLAEDDIVRLEDAYNRPLANPVDPRRADDASAQA